MPRIQPVEKQSASEEQRQVLEQGEQAMGQELNFLNQAAVSPAALRAFMGFNEGLESGTLDKFTHESIYIGTSDYNGCVY